jgi:hypothetical protein
MFSSMKFAMGYLFLGLISWSVGCSRQIPPANSTTSTTQNESATSTSSPPQTEPATLPTEGNPAAEPGVEGQTAAPAAGEEGLSAEVQAALASLSAADREAALKQRICPVSGGPLGSMGAPLKVSVAGHEVFICCEHCEQPLKDDAETHLAKIGLKPAEEPAVQ